MSSTVRNGFSTLNRLLGKKNKDSSLSKSTSNLSKSITNLDSTSQHNKIVPLVAASTNAPFEQTFRITICLPRDQLYVARVGAKTKLWQLLDMVCTNKLLDKNKFEFRHPSDSSQIFSNDLSIGEVGLNEIRLSLKTDSHHEVYPKFHTDEIVKLRQNSRESLSSSEFSKNSGRQYAKTTSPYSSTNSLSSMDSTGLNSRHHPPIAPSRKKRIAPRPPSQNSSSEKSERSAEIGGEDVFKRPHPVMPPKNYFVSSPNLTNNNNNNNSSTHRNNNNNNADDTKVNETDKIVHEVDEHEIAEKVPTRPMSLSLAKSVQANGDRRATFSAAATPATPATPVSAATPVTPVATTPYENHSRTSSDSSEVRDGQPPEPTPRKRTFIGKKKAPAPPPRGLPPVAPPRSVVKADLNEPALDTRTPPSNSNVTKVMLNVEPEPEKVTTSLIRSTSKSPPPPAAEAAQKLKQPLEHIQSTITPVTPLDSPLNEVKLLDKDEDSISQETETDLSTTKTDSSDEDETKVYNIEMGKSRVIETPRKVTENNEVFENLKNENKEVVANGNHKQNGTESTIIVNKNLENIREASPSPRSESPLWTYTLPAPSTFADDRTSVSDVCSTTTADVQMDIVNGNVPAKDESTQSDVPIKAIIKRRIPVDFKALDETSTICDTESSMNSDIEDGYRGDQVRFSRGALLESLESQRDEFIENEFEFLSKLEGGEDGNAVKAGKVNGLEKQNSVTVTEDIPNRKDDVIKELNNVIVNQKLDTVIRKSEVDDHIESVQKSSLSNFTIQSYSNHADVKTESPQPELKTIESTQQGNDTVSSSEATIKRQSSEEHSTKSDDDVELRKPKEFTQSKRASLTNGNLFKSPRVSRSDSFHSTRNGSAEDVGLTSRSSSYISLIGMQKERVSATNTPRTSLTNITFTDSNRRKSSSELSIGDSPSLQSLLVMKSILSNSRKNSLITDNGSNCSKEDEVEVNGGNVATKVEIRSKSPISVDSGDSSKENSPQNKVAPSKIVDDNSINNAKWKYQGPPAINLSTWGERPKSMIAIKTDSDYKFGGTVNSAGVQSTKPGVAIFTKIQTNVPPKPASKPVNVIVETPMESVDVPDHHLPIVRAVVKKVHPTNVKPPEETTHIEIRRPSYEVSTFVSEKPKTEIRTMPPLQHRFSWKIPNTFGTKAPNSTFNKTGPIVRGFKTDVTESSADKDQSIDSGYKSLPPTGVLIQQNQTIVQERPKTQPPPVATKRPIIIQQQKSEELTATAAPFSQFTLRKTGLKEKIVGNDATHNEPVKSPINATLIATTQPIQLRQKQEVPVAEKPVRPVTFHATSTLKPVVNNKITQQSTVPPPPPPNVVPVAPVALRNVANTRKSLPIASDPRDALLDSIKNFNKGNLRKK